MEIPFFLFIKNPREEGRCDGSWPSPNQFHIRFQFSKDSFRFSLSSEDATGAELHPDNIKSLSNNQLDILSLIDYKNARKRRTNKINDQELNLG